MPNIPLHLLKNWFLENKRAFPWREQVTPYAVWVSEVMLQQTRAEVVIPYFLKWMQKFPTLRILSQSAEDEVIKYWEGLGYYSRARNLLAGAKQIENDFGGKIPDNPQDLTKIKGLGPYTINALLSFAFKKRAFPLDGNGIRVLTRLFAIESDIHKPLTIRNLRNLGEMLLPTLEPWIISEAFIELGATICKKTPHCNQCPLKGSCQGFLKGEPTRYPVKTKRTAITTLRRSVAVLRYEKKVLIKKVEKGQLMAGLHEFPYFNVDTFLELENFITQVENGFPVKVLESKPLQNQKQSFTKYKVELQPFYCTVIAYGEKDGYVWTPIEELESKAFSSGHKKVLSSIF